MSLFFLDQQGPVAKIDCLSVDIGSEKAAKANLLIPMSAVAEIILNQQVTADKQAPQWMLGWINWRLAIPLLDFTRFWQPVRILPAAPEYWCSTVCWRAMSIAITALFQGLSPCPENRAGLGTGLP